MPKTIEKPATQKRKRRARTPFPVPPLPRIKLLEGDGEPLESDWHVVQIHLLDELVRQLWHGRTDFFCGGNMFIYYSLRQARSVKRGRPLYKGPDFFVVKDVDGTKPRKYWVVWEEEGRYPDVIVELLSPTTAQKDKEDNLRLYAQTFHTAEYFWYDVETGELCGFRLGGREYVPIERDERGWLWSEELGVWLGVWEGEYQGRRYRWLRLYYPDGSLVPTAAEAERQRAEIERQRAEQALQQAELERQRAEQALQQAEAERQRAERLAQRLRELGYEPE
ncbi:MAG: Uma2 family endonuclease [Armatimonadota bacterium]